MSTIATAILAFVPVLFWGYLFSYYDNSPASARRFLAGLVFGAVAIALVLSLDSVLSFAGLSALNPFSLVASADSGFFALLGGYAAMTTVFSVVVFVFGFLFGTPGADLSARLRGMGAFLAFGLLALLAWRVSATLGLYQWLLAAPLKLEGAVYASVGAVLFYYLLVAASEEAVKHFGFLAGYAPDSDTLSRAVIAGMFVALGFSFVENILYLASIASSGSLLSGLYWQTLRYRSVFATLLHVACSAVLAASFYRSFCVSSQETPGSFAKYLAYWVGISVLAHAVFNSSMVLGFPGIVFAYLVGGYLYITSVLASHEEGESDYAPSPGYL